MNKRTPFLIFVLLSVLLSAQNKRFIYEYSFALDSTNKANVDREIVVLDTDSKGSLFYSLNKFKADSTTAAEIKKQFDSKSEIINIKQNFHSKINYTIQKTYPNFSVFQYTDISGDDYKVQDIRKPKWQIMPQKAKISTFDAQKATTELFGRKWTAWFTTEIPIQDGPYKFYGLPGMIVKLEDDTKSHIFELKEIANYSQNNILGEQIKDSYNNVPAIDQATYKRLFLEQRKDPAKALRMMLSKSGTNVKILGPDGTELSTSEVIRKREATAKETQKKNNNLLELDLLK